MTPEEHIRIADMSLARAGHVDDHVATQLATIASAHYDAAVAAMALEQFKTPPLKQALAADPIHIGDILAARQEAVRQTMQAVFEEIAQEEQAWDRETSRYGTVSAAAISGVRRRLEDRFGSDPT